MSQPDESSSTTGTVHRAFDLLRLVVAAEAPVGVRELARRAGLPTSTTGRLVGTLAELGMVERTARAELAPGPGLAALVPGASHGALAVRELLRPLVGELRDRFGENAALVVDDGDAVRYVASARLDAAVQVADPVGERHPFHLVAPGLVAMAAWPAERLDAHLEGELRAATERSVTDPGEIRARLEAVRRDGWAWTDQELDLEVDGLACPVRDRSGAVVAIASLYGPSYRLSARTSPGLGDAMVELVERRAVALLAG